MQTKLILYPFFIFFYQETSLATTCDSSKQLVVAVLPDDDYYNSSYIAIQHFIQQMSDSTQDLDDFIVLYSQGWDKRFHDQGYDSVKYGKNGNLGLPFGEKTLRIVSKYPMDLWARDFGLVAPLNPVKFKYSPQYLNPRDADLTDEDFNGLMNDLDIAITRSSIALDGGNVVDNNYDKAIISERLLKENPKQTKEELKNSLENVLNMTIALIPDPGPKDTTGHSDGLVSFIEEDTILIAFYNDTAYYNDIQDSILKAFPGVKTIKMSCDDESLTSNVTNWRGFSSAVGGYVNMLVTNNAVYVPQFGKEKCDKDALDLVKANTNKTVKSIDTSKLSHMGGSVRCMTFQVESCHPISKHLLAEARKKSNHGSFLKSPGNYIAIAFIAYLYYYI